MKIITVLRLERLARDTAAAEASMAALNMSSVPNPLDIEHNNIFTADSNDDDWSAYFSSLRMPDMIEELPIPMLPELVIAPSPLVVEPLVVPPLSVNHRRGHVPINPLISTEEAILAGLIAASPENKAKIRQRYMSKCHVRACSGASHSRKGQ